LVRVRHALSSRCVMQVRLWPWLPQLVTKASAAPTADATSVSSGPFTLFMFDCPRCCDLTRLCWLVASPPVRDLLFFAKDLFVAAKHARNHWPAMPTAELVRADEVLSSSPLLRCVSPLCSLSAFWG
jgi:hypothetical protein